MYSEIKPNPPGMREKNDRTAMKIDKHNRKLQMAKKIKFNPRNPHHQDLMDEAREVQRDHRSHNNEE